MFNSNMKDTEEEIATEKTKTMYSHYVRKGTIVGCSLCGRHNVTLYKLGEMRLCSKCKKGVLAKAKEEANE